MMDFLVKNLKGGARYAIQVRSISENDVSEWSPRLIVDAEADASIPANVTGLTGLYTNRLFKFTWNAVITNQDGTPAPDVDGYRVTISDGVNSYIVITAGTVVYVDESDYITKLGNGDTVTCSVVAKDASGNQSVTPATTNVSAPTPDAPTNFSAAGKVSGIDLTWTPVSNTTIEFYEVYVGDTGGFTPDTVSFTNLIGTTAGNTISWAQGSTSEVTKYFKIRAKSIYNEYSTFSSDDTMTLEVVSGGGGGGGGGTSDPRIIFNDDCYVETLPAGVSSTGDLDFNSTYIERQLGGTGASTYDTPEFPLNGTVLVVFEGRTISGHTAGDFNVKIMKGASTVARVTYQVDTNCVAYNSAGSARGNSSTHTVQNGEAFRIAISVDSTAFYCGASFTPVTGGSNTTSTDSQNTDFFSTNNWTSGLGGLTEGDDIFIRLETSSTRLVGISRLAVTRGSESRGGGFTPINLQDFVDTPPTSPDAMDDEFNDESFNTSLWTDLNIGSVAKIESMSTLALSVNENIDQLRGVYQTVPAGDWTFMAKILQPSDEAQYFQSNLFVAASTVGVVYECGYWCDNEISVRGLTRTSPTGAVAAWSGAKDYNFFGFGHIYIKAQYVDSTDTLTMSVSPTGHPDSFVIWGTQASFTPGIIGLGISNRQNASRIATFEWFRRIA
jgi:hypothetical protein